MQRVLGCLLVALVLAVAGCDSQSTGPRYRVAGQALAGPTCPVEPTSPAPGQCLPRLVAGAVLVIAASDGHEVARITTGADGRFALELPAGAYTLTPQPVVGLLGVAPTLTFMVSASGAPTDLRVEYDTGIR